MHHAIYASPLAAPKPETGPPRERAAVDRFALAIGIGATLLVTLLFLVVLAQPRQAQPMDESRPASVVHNYYLSLTQGDLAKAYGYLWSEAKQSISYEQFAARVTGTPGAPGLPERRGIRIDDEQIEDGTARVTVRTSYLQPGVFPFSSGERAVKRTIVLRREDGAWKIAPPQPLYGRYGPSGPYEPYDWFLW